MARERSQTVTASYDFAEDINIQGNYVWNTGTLAWEKQTSAGGGGGGGPVTIADGADTVEGTLADAAIVTDANGDRKSTRLNSSHVTTSRMPSSA